MLSEVVGPASMAESPALYPPLWDVSPGRFQDYLFEAERFVINPWNYLERMGMYKTLLSQSARYLADLGPNNEENMLWGLPLQHGWQFHTGRLADPTNVTTCGYEAGDPLCISEESWWACMNYHLCTFPVLAAVDAGIMGVSSNQVQLLPPQNDQENFCYNVSDCESAFPEVMNKWKVFYKSVVSSESSEQPAERMDNLLKLMWDAHVETLEAGGVRCAAKLPYYDPPEYDFGNSWVTAVDFLSSLRFPTTQRQTAAFQRSLPPRLLLSADSAPFIPDFTPMQNQVLFVLNSLHQMNTASDYDWSCTLDGYFIANQTGLEHFLKCVSAKGRCQIPWQRDYFKPKKIQQRQHKISYNDFRARFGLEGTDTLGNKLLKLWRLAMKFKTMREMALKLLNLINSSQDLPSEQVSVEITLTESCIEVKALNLAFKEF
ncbi:protein LEG1 homolog [Tachyglossus aculeatus]|uniref:protein LEG1 homolog n=1 Tax=Tachyglossus aculeatus TaxID=9261 RepID=UPI0018F5AC42|nr:protein LEG1 homolog [Tachyglossus aculeatus]